ncbi:MAG: FUSC family protein, partial [Chloroflexi bacterium]|nr:FUSC family protein [Chloroflexota bacterium]
PLMLASICGVLALAIYGMTGPRYQYAWLVFGFTTIIILVKALAGSDQIETLSFERASLTALGVLIVFVADALFWPVRAEEQLRESLAERTRQLGDNLTQHLKNLGSAQAPGETAPPPSSPLIQQLGLVEQFREEIGVTRARVQAFSRIALLLEALASRTRLLARESRRRSSSPIPSVRTALAQLGAALDTALAKASRALSTDRGPEPFAEALEHSLASFEGERMAELDARVRQEAGERAETDGEAERVSLISVVSPILQDVVRLLRSLEEALLDLVKQAGPANESKGVRETNAAPISARGWFRVDPIRLQLALRAGIAGGGVIVAMLAMGWSLEEDLLAMIMAPVVAFILAGMSSTRGAARMIGIGLTAGIFLGWLIADLATVFLFTHLDRMPLSLVYPFAIAGGAGYLIVRGSPLGPLGTLFGMLTALLPVFIGDGPPQDVDVSYGLVCGLLLGTAAGLIAQRALWPRTAMQTFLERAAAQLDLCARTLSGGERSSEGTAPGQNPGTLVSTYAKQLTLLGRLHAQAHAEPVERALDDTRRAELLALTQNLFDACLLSRGIAPGETGPTPQDAEAALASLRAALLKHDEALRSSIAASARVLRGGTPEAGLCLAEAQTALEVRLDEVRGHREVARAAGPQQVDAFLSYVDARRELVARQLAIEAWLADWRRAVGSRSASV